MYKVEMPNGAASIISFSLYAKEIKCCIIAHIVIKNEFFLITHSSTTIETRKGLPTIPLTALTLAVNDTLGSVKIVKFTRFYTRIREYASEKYAVDVFKFY